MLFEAVNGSATKEYLFLNGELPVTILPVGPIPRYHFTDHLGSLRVFAGWDGSQVWRHDYYPLGLERTATADGETHKFTRQEHDAETSFDHFWFRQHPSGLGRFMTPDPIAGSVTDPQSLNRYAYVQNDPVNGTDPLGLYISYIRMLYSAGTPGGVHQPTFPDWFQLLFSAESSFFSIGGSHLHNALWEADEREVYGDRYWDLPGRYGDVEQGMAQYDQMVFETWLENVAKRSQQNLTPEERRRREECAWQVLGHGLDTYGLRGFVVGTPVYRYGTTFDVNWDPSVRGYLDNNPSFGWGYRTDTNPSFNIKLKELAVNGMVLAGHADWDYYSPRRDAVSAFGHLGEVMLNRLRDIHTDPCRVRDQLGLSGS